MNNFKTDNPAHPRASLGVGVVRYT